MEQRLVTVKWFLWLAEADLAYAALRSYGIQAFLGDQYFLLWFPLHSVALGGVKLQVSESEAEDAFAILRSLTHEKTCCPSCGSTDVYLRDRYGLLLFGLSAAVLAVMICAVTLVAAALTAGALCYMPPRRLKRICRCRHCGHTWHYPRGESGEDASAEMAAQAPN